MKRFFDAVRDMPSTNVRIFVGIGLAIVYVLGSMLGAFLIGITASFRPVPINVLPPQDVHEWIGIFILIMLGIDTTQFAIKRATTHKPGGETVVETEKVVERERTVEAG